MNFKQLITTKTNEILEENEEYKKDIELRKTLKDLKNKVYRVKSELFPTSYELTDRDFENMKEELIELDETRLAFEQKLNKSVFKKDKYEKLLKQVAVRCNYLKKKLAEKENFDKTISETDFSGIDNIYAIENEAVKKVLIENYDNEIIENRINKLIEDKGIIGINGIYSHFELIALNIISSEIINLYIQGENEISLDTIKNNLKGESVSKEVEEELV